MHFPFTNSGFNLLKYDEDDIYVEIGRYIRKRPFIGMKQPTPFGAHLGFEIIMIIKHLGLPIENCHYTLRKDDNIIQSGITDSLGKAVLQIHGDDMEDYVLEINEDIKSCNILSEISSKESNQESKETNEATTK